MDIQFYPSIHNETVSLVKEFIDGKFFTPELAEKVFRSYEAVESTTNPNLHTYKDHIQEARQLCKKYEAKVLTEDIFFFNCTYPETVSRLVKVTIVRLVNLCHQGRLTIVLGNEVLYLGLHHQTNPDFPKTLKKKLKKETRKNSIKFWKENSKRRQDNTLTQTVGSTV